MSFLRHGSFTVPGKPVPKGSRTSGFTKSGRPYSREANKHVGPWMKRAKEELRRQAPEGAPFSPPYVIDLRFFFAPPKVPSWPRTGDVDKFARAALDALTQAGIIEDDRHVVELGACKRYSDDPRTEIEVREVSQS